MFSWFATSKKYCAYPWRDHASLLGIRHGVLLAESGEIRGVSQRYFGYQASYWESWWDRTFRIRRGDRVWLHYSWLEPEREFISLKYVVSARETSLRTVHRALSGLQQIATLGQAYAIVCSISNPRLHDGVMQRFGYERHAFRVPGNHFILRLRQWKDRHEPDTSPSRLECEQFV